MDDIVKQLKIAHITYAIIYLLGFVLIEFILTIDFSLNGGEPSALVYYVYIMYFTYISLILLAVVDIFILWMVRNIKHPVYFVPVAIVACAMAAIAAIYIDFSVGTFIEMKLENMLFKSNS